MQPASGTAVDLDLRVVDAPLAAELLARLRDATTGTPEFREAAARLAVLLVTEATRDLPTRTEQLRTPVGTAQVRRSDATVVALPVLRAGLGLLSAVTALFPDCLVGFLGLERDHVTHLPREYYRKIPPARGAYGLVLEPMLATGGSATVAVRCLREAGAADVAVVSVVAAPEGIARLAADHPGLVVVTAAVDEGLTPSAYITPGLGDFGDRLFGTVAEPQLPNDAPSGALGS